MLLQVMTCSGRQLNEVTRASQMHLVAGVGRDMGFQLLIDTG